MMFIRNRHLPDFIYNFLPYLYIFTGIYIILTIDNNAAIFSGLMLLSAGALVMRMRMTFRNKKTDSESDDILQIKTLNSGSAQLIWSKKYECGNKSIDAQHKKLFETGNALLDVIYNNKQHSKIVMLVEMLLNDIKQHFSSEEELLEIWGHPLSEEHKQAHQSLLEKASKMHDKLEEYNLSYKDIFDFFVNDLVLHHIVQDDKKFFFQI